MAKKGHSEEQILRALRQAEGGTRVADICREHGISEATFYIYGRLPCGKKNSGPGLTKSIANIYSASPEEWCAQMGNPLTLASTTGRPRGPM